MYKFVFGGTQSGKSHKVFSDCIDASLRDEARRFIVMVPEQATTAAERELIRLHPYHAMSSIEVLSFNRLAYRVFEELGIRNPEVLDDISKSMIIRRLAANVSGELTVWKNSFDKPGFIDNLKSMISELYQYGVGPDELDGTSDEHMNIRLKSKLHDLKLMYRVFSSYIKDRYITPEEIPDILAREIHRSQLIKDATIVLDGFTGFTPIQYRIIESFMMYAREVVISINIAEGENPYAQPASEELFGMSRRIVADATDIASRLGVPHGEDIWTIRRPKLDFLERHLLRYDGATSEPEAISIVRALNINEESMYIAAQIQKKVKEEGCRYRDIAVVGADIESYSESLRHELELSEIPYYMDENTNLSSNVLPAFIQAAAEVIRSDYSYESMMRYLRTGLVSDNEEMINALDIYMYECGRRGYARMSETWDYVPNSLQGIDIRELNSFKSEILEPLEVLRTFKGSWMDYVLVIRQLLEGLNIENKLLALSEAFAGRQSAADKRRKVEYEQAYVKIIELLDRIGELAGDDVCNPVEFIETFMAGVSQIKLGQLPAGADRVMIGDLTRSRLEHIKHLYVAGANEGSIPKLLNRASVITDSEKLILEDTGLKLAPTVKEDLYMQRYYLYRVLTKPEESLTLSYSGMDAEGAAKEPSYIIAHIKKLYPHLTEMRAADQIGIMDIKSAERLVADRLRRFRQTSGFDEVKNDKEFADVLASLLADKAYVRAAESLISAAFFRYTADRISTEAADKVYGDDVRSSITRLESFADCPFRHFARYGLNLYEIRKFTMGAIDIGNIVHATMEKIYSAAQRKKIDLFKLDDGARDELVRACVNEAVLDDPSAKYTDSSHNRYIISRIERVAGRTLWAQLQEFEASGYRPFAWEQSFTHNNLTGRIDRIDIAVNEDPSEPAKLRVVDLKTGSKKFSLSDMALGYDMQLGIYMSAAEEYAERYFRETGVTPSGMYYSTIKDPIIDLDKKSVNKTVEEEILKELSLSGIGGKEDDELRIRKLMKHADAKADELRADIRSGNVAIAPGEKNNTNSCTYCPYKAVCGFDKKLPGYTMPKRKNLSDEDAWKIIASGQVNS